MYLFPNLRNVYEALESTVSFIWQLDFYHFLLLLGLFLLLALLYIVQGDLLRHLTSYTVVLLGMNLVLQEEWRCANPVINHAQIFSTCGCLNTYFPSITLIWNKIVSFFFMPESFDLIKMKAAACSPLQKWCHRKSRTFLTFSLSPNFAHPCWGI